MATSYYLRSKKNKGPVTIFLRIRSTEPKVNIIISSGIEVPVEKWLLDRNGTAWKNFRDNPENKAKLDMLENMKAAINEKIKVSGIFSNDDARKIIDGILYEVPRRKARQAEEEAQRAADQKNKMTLNKFIKQYIRDIENGARQTDRGVNYGGDTVRAIRGAMNQFFYFQRDRHKSLDFDDIDMPFYYAFTEYLKGKNYSINTIGKDIANLKVILRTAYDEGFTNNRKWDCRKFKAVRVDVDTIYLTEDELTKMISVNLSELPVEFEQARDIFMVGVRLAQRVSDYNYLTQDMISTINKHVIVEEPDPDNPGQTIAHIEDKTIHIARIVQEKTNKRVAVPCHPQVVEILQKYNYHMPSLSDQTINDNIKIIGKLAGLTDKIEIIETKGGVEKRIFKEKWEMITTHTARRTGATLMYLAGMDCFDIMKITGHDSTSNLKKYIKADELDVALKLTDKYDYFG